MKLDELKKNGEAPEWMDDAALETLVRGYLLPNETPKGMYVRIAKSLSSYYTNPDYWFDKFFNAMWSNWLCPSSPVLANSGTKRGLTVSCNTVHFADSVNSIFMKNHEIAMLTKNGAGIGFYVGDIRARAQAISGGGKSEGVLPWLKVIEQTILSTAQAGVRRGSAAAYLPVEHGDIHEFLEMRRKVGDPNLRCRKLNHGICITDNWMSDMLSGNKEKQDLWKKILVERVQEGEPYLFFTDSVNKANPECYKKNNLDVKASNLCSEITLFTDKDHSFICCLSSLNLARYDEWKDTDIVETSIRFLDAVLQEYIDKSDGIPGLEASRRSAIKGRALGLGVLGWHTLLQSKNLPFDSFESMRLNNEIFKLMRERADAETAKLAVELGEPEWCKGFNRRNTHTLAIAPTVSNSTISGGVSPGIEPFSANFFAQKSAKGVFIRKNKYLEKLLDSKNKNTPEVWKSINQYSGSVQHLDFLSDEEKEVFLTAREINQHAVIKQAAQRQRWIDQAQSVNLFFAENAEPQYIHDVHIAAWKMGLKTLYYMRSEGVLSGDLASRSKEECEACSG